MKSAFRIAAARHRLERGIYDRPEVIAATAQALLHSGDLASHITDGMDDAEAAEREERDRLIILPQRGDCGDDDTVDEFTEHDSNGEA